MAVEIEKTGKTIDDAKRAALEELQVAENMVEFEVWRSHPRAFWD